MTTSIQMSKLASLTDRLQQIIDDQSIEDNLVTQSGWGGDAINIDITITGPTDRSEFMADSPLIQNLTFKEKKTILSILYAAQHRLVDKQVTQLKRDYDIDITNHNPNEIPKGE